MGVKSFVEIGSDDGVYSNSASLYFNFGWHGLFIGGNPRSVKRGRKFFSKYPHPWFYKPKFVCDMVKRENVNQLIEGAGFKGEVGLLCIDIDGNDYWVWDAIFVKNGLADKFLPEVSVESLLTHPSTIEGYRKFEAIKDWEYQEG